MYLLYFGVEMGHFCFIYRIRLSAVCTLVSCVVCLISQLLHFLCVHFSFTFPLYLSRYLIFYSVFCVCAFSSPLFYRYLLVLEFSLYIFPSEINFRLFFSLFSWFHCRKSFYRRIKAHSDSASLAVQTIHVCHLVHMIQAFSYHM